MKFSQFNTFVNYKENFVFHNSLTNKFLHLNPLLKDLIETSKKENNVDGLKLIHSELYKALVELGFVVSKSTNEIKKAGELIHRIDFNPENYQLIINPTMNCNFNCWYCYETHEKSSRVSNITIKKIKLFISKVITEDKRIKTFVLKFFGGEPLLYFKKVVLPIMKYTSEITKKNAIGLTISITTNAYLITDEMIKYFIKYKVHGFQITFDGNKENHNKVRYVSNNKGSYDILVKNVIKLIKKNFQVTLRINYTKENLAGLDEILVSFKDLSKKEKERITLSMNRVWEEKKSKILGKLVFSFTKKAKAFGFSIPDAILSDRVRNSCYADKLNQVTINYNGDVYKCNARDFKKNNREGVLNSEGYIEWNEKFHFRMDVKLKNKPCLKCSILPICGGGCRQQAIEYYDKNYCTNDFDEEKKRDIVLNMFLSENVEANV